MVSQTYTAATVLIGYIHRPLSSLHIWADCCTSIEIQSVFLIVKSQGGTNTLCLVSEGCLTLFVCCINVSLPCKARLFSFLYLLLCLKYIILLLLLTKKAGCSLSLSRFQECRNWILHLKVNFHDGITQISLSLFHPFASIHLSFIFLHFDASLHLLWFTLFIWRHLFFTLNSPTHVFPLCIVTLPLANLCVCLCVRVHIQMSCPGLFSCKRPRKKKS